MINYLHDIEDQSAAATHGINTIRETLIKAINNHNIDNDNWDELEENLKYTLINTQTLINILESLQNKVDSERRKEEGNV